MGEDLRGRVAVVTGASRGIGAAVAKRLSREGVRLGLLSRNGTDLSLGDARGFRCDVGDSPQVAEAVAETAREFGGLDILINNAGVGSIAPFLELDPEHIEEMIDTNLKGTIYATRAALPHLLESDAADIVTIASMAGLRGFPRESVYCASKWGQVGLMRALDHELSEHGVRCSSLCPGGVATDFASGRGGVEDPDDRRTMMSGDEVADTVVFTLTRPRGHRILTLSYQPILESAAG